MDDLSQNKTLVWVLVAVAVVVVFFVFFNKPCRSGFRGQSGSTGQSCHSCCLAMCKQCGSDTETCVPQCIREQCPTE